MDKNPEEEGNKIAYNREDNETKYPYTKSSFEIDM